MKKGIIICTIAIVVGHFVASHKGLMEDYEAFTCSLGYISIASIIISLLPESAIKLK